MIESIIFKLKYLVSWLLPISNNMGSTCGNIDDLYSLKSLIHLGKINEEIDNIINTRIGGKSTMVNIEKPLYAILRKDMSHLEVVSISVPPKSLESTVTLKLVDSEDIVKVPYSLFKMFFDVVGSEDL